MDAPQRRLQALSNHFDSLSLGNGQKLESTNCAVSAESEILNIERRRIGVPAEKLTEIFFGGADKVKIWKETYERLAQEPIFSNTLNVDDKSHGEIRELSMERIRRLFDLESWKLDNKSINVLGRVIYVIDPSTAIRLGVHTGLFLGSVTGNGTEYHRKKYFKPGTRAKIFGCFGMTELGHGSNAAGLETTATFDKKNQEFIINSPTLTSTKWWIGGAAETATHCCVFARLIIGEKDYGVHAFIVPLRDIKTHKPLPGVTIGDCGAKMGMNGIDNGYLRFANVRIPREDMLDQYARVEPDGSYWKAGKSALALQRVALIGARCNIVGQSALDGMTALTIAIRYSAIRRQFEDGPGKPERTILDYQTHMHRLFLPLSEIAALQFASLALDESHNTLLEELHTGNTNNLGDVHAIAAGMKAFSSWTTRDILTIARDCLGGHGFSSYNKISRMMKDFQVQTTWDGDNTVLSQQTAKYLVSSLQKAMEGKKLKGSVKFLEDVLSIVQSQCAAKDANDLRDFGVHQAAFRWRIATLVATCAQKIQASVAEGMDPMSAWNSSLVDLIALAKAHCDLYKLEAFASAVDKMKNSTEKPKAGHAELVLVLTILRNLYALQIIEKDLGTFRENDYISSDLAKMIKLEVRQLCLELRPYAVFVVDSFAIPDFVLDAPVGCADGNIYERYFDRVKQAPGSPVPPYWDKIIRPLTNNPNEITE